MAAGLGFKTFATGDILTAADANGYLMSQTVMVFADSAARASAITSPQEGMITYLKDTNATQYYSGSAWVAVGGSSPLTTKGDLYTYSTTDARLGVGTNGQVLSADSTAATGLAWATASSGSLVKISSTSFSNVASQDIDTVFNSTYDTYLVSIVRCSAATGGDDLQLQMRYSTSTQTADYFGALDAVTSLGSSTITGAHGTSLATLANGCGLSGYPTSAVFNVVMPAGGGNSGRPAFYGNSMNAENGEIGNFGYEIANGRVYTGFRLKSSSSNITGLVVVYGLVK